MNGLLHLNVLYLEPPSEMSIKHIIVCIHHKDDAVASLSPLNKCCAQIVPEHLDWVGSEAPCLNVSHLLQLDVEPLPFPLVGAYALTN